MAKISTLPPHAEPLVGTETLPIVVGNNTKRVPVQAIKDAAAAAAQIHSQDAAAAAGTSAIKAQEAGADAAVAQQALAGVLDAIGDTPIAGPITFRAVNRAAMAAITDPVSGDGCVMGEAIREGIFVWRSGDYSAEIARDPRQAFHVPRADDPQGLLGAWVRQNFGVARPEDFGAVGDGVTNDTTAFVAIGRFISACGGGTINYRPNATYLVGGDFNQPFRDPAAYTYYRFVAVETDLYIVPIENCTHGVVINGNGARMRNAGGKYGTFNNDETPKVTAPGYLGDGAATPYYQMLRISHCAAVTILNLELDGNIGSTVIGGNFSDTGIQLQMTGLYLGDNAGPIRIENVFSHDHGLDGLQVNGKCALESAPSENAKINACRFTGNGRLGMAFVGGKGWAFDACSFDHNAKAIGSNGVALGSNPGAGVDFEAEGGKLIRDITFDNSTFIDNRTQGIVADSGTNTRNVTFSDCTFVGTTGYSCWPNRPGFKFYRCKFYGTIVSMWVDPVDPRDSFFNEDCTFSTETHLSPTGSVYVINNLPIEGGALGHVFDRATVVQGGAGSAAVGNLNGPLFINGTFLAKSGGLGVNGRFAGRDTAFVEAGGAITHIPGGGSTFVGFNDAGTASDSWTFRTGGATKRYSATVDGSGNLLAYRQTASSGLVLIAGTDAMTQILVNALTADVTWTLSATNARIGSRFIVRRDLSASGAFIFTVNGPGGLTTTLGVGKTCTFEYVNDTVGWILVRI